MVSEHMNGPQIIQGGMGVAVSNWKLARAVARRNQLGVVSGTAIDAVLVRRLQNGDPDGDIRHALDEFPFPEMTERILHRYFIPGGKQPEQPYAPTMMISQQPTSEQIELVVIANFVEVLLAKTGHDGLVGINYLEKIQTPTLPSLYGAMLAGVDYVLMGAGIPRWIPGILDRLSEGQPVTLPLAVVGALATDNYCLRFSPHDFTCGEVPWLRRPKFLAIVASTTLGTMLAAKSDGHVDGFVIEGPTAGGHNSPPRGGSSFNEQGEPIYGLRDAVDLSVFRKLGRPFWLAGSYGFAEQLPAAMQQGAAGIQVGTAFAFCQESGIEDSIKQRVIALAKRNMLSVRTDPVASPTGFPFKLLQLNGTIADDRASESRCRVCDLGYLRQAFRKADGTVGWRCSGEPINAYLKKGGEIHETAGRKCLCNGLMATVGLGQQRRRGAELPMVTCGNEVNRISQFLKSPAAGSYSADDVLDALLGADANSRLEPVSSPSL
ncbi:MAG: nitronate monooxygenase [Pirellulaceae bacterium]|nr:nitronate monooxygenase [Pirellulaceae bacterium]